MSSLMMDDLSHYYRSAILVHSGTLHQIHLVTKQELLNNVVRRERDLATFQLEGHAAG
jgi:hypothetical protein